MSEAYSRISNSPKWTISAESRRECQLDEGFLDGFDDGWKIFLEIAFPDGYYCPAESFEVIYFSLISRDVAIELGLPEFGVVFG